MYNFCGRDSLKKRTANIIFCALFVAIIAVCAQIMIPTPFFPITLQTFGIALCGYTLGARKSAFSVLGYILLGVLGMPIFSGFCGGFHHITDPGGGFAAGFLPFAIFCGMASGFNGKLKKILIGILGATVMYCIGIAYFCLITGTKILSPTALVFLAIFLKDIIAVAISFYISEIIKKRILK